MECKIDGKPVKAQMEQSLLELVRQEGFEDNSLVHRPLAAKIAGEVFTLNYIPFREQDVQPKKKAMRRAMEASGGEIRLLR